MVATGAVVANSTRHWVAKVVREGGTKGVDVAAMVMTVRAEFESGGDAGASESGVGAVGAEKEMPANAAAMDTDAMTNVRVTIELYSCEQAQCHAYWWERD